MAVSTIADDKKKALNLAIAQIEKSCGKGSIMRLGSDNRVRVDAIPTGAINLDAAIGVGGGPELDAQLKILVGQPGQQKTDALVGLYGAVGQRPIGIADGGPAF